MAKYGIRDVINAIASDNYYPVVNRHGGIDLYPSRDFSEPGLLENIIREHQYVDSLEASKGLTFQLERDRFRTSVAKDYAPASCFYNLVSAPKPNPPPGYVFGEVSNLLFEVAKC